jgi:hypothetical protein
MKRILSLAVLAMFGLAIAGCHASVDAGDGAAGPNGSHYEKKTTTYGNGGTSSTHTETTTRNP